MLYEVMRVVLQSRPLAVDSGHIEYNSCDPWEQQIAEEPLYEGGVTASRGLASGPVVHLLSQNSGRHIAPGTICVVRETPSYNFV